MSFKNTKENYGHISKALHWSLAVLIFGLLAMGFLMDDLEPDSLKYKVYGIHKSFGVLVLMLVAVRIVWHGFNHPPVSLSTYKPVEKLLAKIVKIALYLAMIALPVSGVVMSLAGGHDISFFGLFELAGLEEKNKPLSGLGSEIHEVGAFVILGLLFLHVAGSFKHHFIAKDETLQRITSSKVGIIGGFVLLFLSLALLAAPFYMFSPML